MEKTDELSVKNMRTHHQNHKIKYTHTPPHQEIPDHKDGITIQPLLSENEHLNKKQVNTTRSPPSSFPN